MLLDVDWMDGWVAAPPIAGVKVAFRVGARPAPLRVAVLEAVADGEGVRVAVAVAELVAVAVL